MNIQDKDGVLDYWRQNTNLPEEALEDLYLIAVAVNDNDARAEEHSSPAPVIAQDGWSEPAVTYMADQRALRIALLIEHGREVMNLATAGMSMIRPNRQITMAAAMAWLDGFAASAAAVRQGSNLRLNETARTLLARLLREECQFPGARDERDELLETARQIDPSGKTAEYIIHELFGESEER